MYCFYVSAVALLLVAHHSFVSVAFIVRFVSFEAVRHLLLDTTHRYDTAVGIIHTNVKRETNTGILFLMFSKLALSKY